MVKWLSEILPRVTPTLAQRLLDGDRRALARAITLVEDDRPEGWELVREVYPHTGKAAVYGFTGPTRRRQVDADRRADQGKARGGRSVGVLSIDPSSPFTQGALLGDRIRLTEHFLDQGVFIRSMANRGALGGLSEAALQAALLLDAAGREDVFVETVGVGQAEIDIIDHADTIVLVLMPGSGDSIQALKAGVMEIPDIIVINKADHPLTDTMVREIRGVLSLANLERRLRIESRPPALARADRQDRGRPRQGRGRVDRPASTPTARTSWGRGPCKSGVGATCATRSWRSPPRACAGAWRRSCARTRSSSGCWTRSSSDGLTRPARPRRCWSDTGADYAMPMTRVRLDTHIALYACLLAATLLGAGVIARSAEGQTSGRARTAEASHLGWPTITGMLLQNSTNKNRPLDGRPGHDPFDGTDPSYSCDGADTGGLYHDCGFPRISDGPRFTTLPQLEAECQQGGSSPAAAQPPTLSIGRLA